MIATLETAVTYIVFVLVWLWHHRRTAGAGILIGLVVGGVILHLNGRIARQDEQLSSNRRCYAYLTDAAGGRRGDCPPAVLVLYDAARRAEICDAAMKLGGYAPECAPGVVQAVTDRAALQAQLAATRADATAAIARAEARATQSAQRKSHDAQVLAVAPRADDLIVCDTLCLRARFDTFGPDGPEAR